jgi:hypothetical protein
MPADIALDNRTGDLLLAPNNDVTIYRGEEVVAQRIRTRLLIPVGTWALDDTGLLGSRLLDMTRLTNERAIEEIPLVVKEALNPMDDIRVVEVDVTPDLDHSNVLGVTVVYAIMDDTGVADETGSFDFAVQTQG